MLLMGYARSPFRYFEKYLRIEVGLDEDDIWLILKQYHSNSNSDEIPLDIYSVYDISEAVYTMGDHEGILKFEKDAISMKTKLILKPFGGTFGTLIFNEKIFK